MVNVLVAVGVSIPPLPLCASTTPNKKARAARMRISAFHSAKILGVPVRKMAEPMEENEEQQTIMQRLDAIHDDHNEIRGKYYSIRDEINELAQDEQQQYAEKIGILNELIDCPQQQPPPAGGRRVRKVKKSKKNKLSKRKTRRS